MCIEAVTRAQSRNEGYIYKDNELDFSLDNIERALINYGAVTWEDIRNAAQACVPSQLTQLKVSVTRTIDMTDEGNQQNNLRDKFCRNWGLFGGYKDLKEKIYRTVLSPWTQHMFGINHYQSEKENTTISHLTRQIMPPSGILFHGPIGTGKSLAAQCVASSLGLNVVNVRASDVLDQWLGASELTVRLIFTRARAAAPCILFVDGIDGLTSNREEGTGDSTNVHSRILSTFLNEIDGISNGDGSQRVLVLATTNQFDSIDGALLRPGRLEEHFFFDKPNLSDIIEILNIYLTSMPLDWDIKLGDIAKCLHELAASAADIRGICMDAGMHAIRRVSYDVDHSEITIKMVDFDVATRMLMK